MYIYIYCKQIINYLCVPNASYSHERFRDSRPLHREMFNGDDLKTSRGDTSPPSPFTPIMIGVPRPSPTRRNIRPRIRHYTTRVCLTNIGYTWILQGAFVKRIIRHLPTDCRCISYKQFIQRNISHCTETVLVGSSTRDATIICRLVVITDYPHQRLRPNCR